MDTIEQRLEQFPWPYASQDRSVCREIARRIAEAGRTKETIRYTDLVRGIDFHLATVNGGEPIRLGVPDWSDLHRAILGDFLGHLCVETYRKAKFMGSALAVASDTGQPSEGYRDLMRQLGVLRGRSEDEFLTHWSNELNKAYAWYQG